MIDLHTHLLPAVDDGARTLEQAVATLERFVAVGVREVCLTPHLVASRVTEGPPPAHDEAFALLAASAPAAIRLHRGAEIMLDRQLTRRAVETRRVTLGGTRYILVEFGRMVAPSAATAALAAVVEAGLVPLVAHPERYASCSAATVQRWKEIGALMQVDANTLFHGTTRGERARALLAAGLGDILASDNHGDDRSLSEPYERLAEIGGAAATLLTATNPAAILAGEPTEPVPAVDVKLAFPNRVRAWLDRFRQ